MPLCVCFLCVLVHCHYWEIKGIVYENMYEVSRPGRDSFLRWLSWDGRYRSSLKCFAMFHPSWDTSWNCSVPVEIPHQICSVPAEILHKIFTLYCISILIHGIFKCIIMNKHLFDWKKPRLYFRKNVIRIIKKLIIKQIFLHVLKTKDFKNTLSQNQIAKYYNLLLNLQRLQKNLNIVITKLLYTIWLILQFYMF